MPTRNDGKLAYHGRYYVVLKSKKKKLKIFRLFIDKSKFYSKGNEMQN